MGWFDEQIEERKRADSEALEESFLRIAGAVMGKRLSAALNDQRQSAKDAIEELLKYYRVKAREVPRSVEDMNEILEFLLRPYGIMRRNVKLEKFWYRDATGPMLGTRTDDGSVVALIPDSFSGYSFFDVKSGTRLKVNSKTQELIDGEAIAFYKPFPLKKMGLRDLWRFLTENVGTPDVAPFLLSAFVATLAGLLTPRLNALLFANVLPSGSTGALAAVSAALICATVSALLFGAIRSISIERITRKLSVLVEAAAMMRILSLPAAFFKQYGSGELSTRVQYLTLFIENVVGVGLSAGLVALFSLLYVTQIFVYAPALVTPALCVLFATVAVSAISALIQTGVTRERMKLASKERGMAYALISGVQKIKLSGAEKRAFARWGRLYAEEAELLYNPPFFLKVSAPLNTAITLAGTFAIYYAAVKNGVSAADYYAFNAAYALTAGAFTQLSTIALEMAQIVPALDMARPILEAEPEVAEEKQLVERLTGGIELNNVTFRYREDMPPVLDNLSLKIRPGQYVAIVGKSGCGKSTLMRILLGFETPQKGAVYYDGKDITRLDLKSLRRKIGVVMQDGKLFSGDLYSNIVISAPWLTLDQAWEAAETAGIADDIRAMPMGMFTLMSEGQGGISGGQRQRILIARAIAPKPKILMMDEATSALDNVTQKKVSDSLGKYKSTRIVIAHRLSTIRQCDRIIVLDGGRIIEDGTYDKLMKKNGFFAELVSRQQLDAANA